MLQQNIKILFFLLFPIVTIWGQPPAILIDYQTNIDVKPNQRTRMSSYLIQINNKEGAKFTNVQIPFSGSDKIKVKTVEIRDMDGNVLRKLKKKDIKERSNIVNIALYSDDFVKYFNPKWNTYPYQIFYEYEIKSSQFLYAASWFPLLSSRVPTLNASLKIAAPIDYELAISFPDSLHYDRTASDGQVTHEWKVTGYHAPESEAFAPHYRQMLPSVKVLPVDFQYGKKGKQDSWENFGNWQYRLIEGLRELPDSEKAVVDNLIKGMTDKKAIIQTLYNYLQDNHRYILVSIETGGLKPYPASYVCEKRYGDCKALTNYMKALLEYVEIPSFYTKVYAGKRPTPVEVDVPGQQFNHIILGVPLDGDTIWLENTSKTSPVGYLGTFTQNRKALWVDKSDSHLVQLPALEADQPVEKSTYFFKLDKKGTGDLTVNTTARNQLFESLAFFKNNENPKKIQWYLEKHFPVKNAAFQSFDFDQLDRNKPEINLTSNWTVQRQIRKIGKSLIIKPIQFNDYNLEKPEDRQQDLLIRYPIYDSLTLIYELPFLTEYDIELPDSIDIQTKFGTTSFIAKQMDNQIIITQSQRIFSGHYKQEAYKDFYQMLETEKELLKKFTIILKSK